MISLINNAFSYQDRIAIISEGRDYTYGNLLKTSEQIAYNLLDGKMDLMEAPVAFIVAPGFQYTAIQWGIWRAGGIAVPLCVKHPLPSIQYVIEDTDATTIILSEAFESLLSPLKENKEIRFIRTDQYKEGTLELPSISALRRAMILYTSGTTGKPKGVVTTHQNIESQITSLTSSWEWDKDDHILNVLPLHHVHGIINVMSCALWSGACCEFLPQFDPHKIFDIFNKKRVNVFMAVPTIYYKLISYWKELPESEQKEVTASLKTFRLMVSGSAALPVTVLEQWKQISGHILLERYGMTEMGMAISNSYRGERKPGYIGLPLDEVKIRIADEGNTPLAQGNQGEIQVQGPNVFKEYWRKREATASTFTPDGWFKTGDIAIFENDAYRILGRNSVDIIKSGGYKISALEIEEVLRTHPQIKECGVVGIPDEEWGEIIGASLILESGTIDFESLKVWLKEMLPAYKIPKKYIIQNDLPRNVMGKVTKNQLKKEFTKTKSKSP
ncbi:acyl-CoA synthetase [Flavobacteriaceae bacterium]|nr:acyl-CoA synthetase [Flavobacteriaceae bacterium]